MEARKVSLSRQVVGEGGAQWCQIADLLQWQMVSVSRDAFFFSWFRDGDIAFSLSLPPGLSGRPQDELTGQAKRFLQSCP